MSVPVNGFFQVAEERRDLMRLVVMSHELVVLPISVPS
jgi:hypothetical protein